MGDVSAFSAYGGLFLSAFVAATILPAQSEALLAALLVSGSFSSVWLLVTASVGNVLGALVNYGIGRLADRFSDRQWFPVRTVALERARGRYRLWGRWSLLLSWVPVVGDPITVAAGLLREPLWSFIVLVTFAKVGRYVIIAAIALNLF